MERDPAVQAEVFLDSAYALALAAPSDQLHFRAVVLSEQLEANRTRLLTTQVVLLEIGNALSKQCYRESAVQLLSGLAMDPLVEIVPLSPDLYTSAFDLHRGRFDKEWGLIDCVSFVVMRSRGIGQALTADEHFEQAGFRALLREPCNMPIQPLPTTTIAGPVWVLPFDCVTMAFNARLS
jgi:predicted nucleic acid-binding protein